jgi:hypothetical protein
LRDGKRRQRFDRHLGPQPHVERVQDLGRTLERDAEIFVSLIARDLRLVLTQTSRELTLRDAFLFDVAMYSYCAM